MLGAEHRPPGRDQASTRRLSCGHGESAGGGWVESPETLQLCELGLCPLTAASLGALPGWAVGGCPGGP